jgi:tripartite-type tricarboxylate transporter receptor subunit TctC
MTRDCLWLCRPRAVGSELLGRAGVAAMVARGLAIALLIAAPTAGEAQAPYPTKPIRLVVGFAAGGPTDLLARVVGAKLGEILGQQVYIENRAGASGNIAAEAVARAEPDGYTLQMSLLSSAVNESLFKNFKYKFAEYFEPVGSLAETGLVLIVHPSLEVKSVSDLIALAKAKPGEVLYATAGKGTATHLAAELFNTTAGIKTNPVHYKGGGETIKDLLSGQVKVMFSTIPPVLGFVRDGRMRGLATTALKRDQALSDLPTIAESGLPGFDVRLWFGITVPKGTPRPVIDRLAAALKLALESEDTLKKFAAAGFTPLPGSPEQFGAFYKSEVEKWAKVVETIGTLGD